MPPAWSLPRFIALTTGATCTELEAIIAVDKQAIRFEQDKLEALAQQVQSNAPLPGGGKKAHKKARLQT